MYIMNIRAVWATTIIPATLTVAKVFLRSKAGMAAT